MGVARCNTARRRTAVTHKKVLVLVLVYQRPLEGKTVAAQDGALVMAAAVQSCETKNPEA